MKTDLKFTKELKEEWIAALKSGKYVQGKVDLIKTEEGVTKHCCLGVLGEIHPELSNDLLQPYEFIRGTISNETCLNLYQTNDSTYDPKNLIIQMFYL